MDEADSVIQWAVGGGSAGAMFFIVRWAFVFVTGRFDKREATIDAGTQTLIEQLQDQVAGLLARAERTDEALEQCRKQHAEAREEVMELRGMIQGLGDARQQAQRIVASERLEDRKYRNE